MKDRILESLSAFSIGTIEGKELALFSDLVNSKKLNLSSDEIKTRSKKLLNYILFNYSNFSISTIDKFNYRLIQTFAQDLGVSSSAEVELDELEILEDTPATPLKRLRFNVFQRSLNVPLNVKFWSKKLHCQMFHHTFLSAGRLLSMASKR